MKFRVVEEDGEVGFDYFALSHEGMLWRFMSRLPSDPRWYHIIPEKNATIQYSTGRTDINGVEMWERDDVQWRGQVGKIIWLNDKHHVGFEIEKEKPDCWGQYGFYDADGGKFDWNELEVIKEVDSE